MGSHKGGEMHFVCWKGDSASVAEKGCRGVETLVPQMSPNQLDARDTGSDLEWTVGGAGQQRDWWLIDSCEQHAGLWSKWIGGKTSEVRSRYNPGPTVSRYAAC
jgi:hypothetical protein